MDNDKRHDIGAIAKDKIVIMKGKDAIGHDKAAIKVVGKKENTKNIKKENAPQKKPQEVHQNMLGGKKAINGVECG